MLAWSDKDWQALAYTFRSSLFRDLGDLPGSLAEAKKAIEANPRDLRGYVERAITRRLMTGEAGIEGDCRDFAGLARSGAWQFLERGRTMWSLCHREDLALSDFFKAMELAPSWGTPYLARAAMHRGPKHYQEALADLGQAIEKGPTDPDPFESRGLVYMDLERFEDALADFDRCAALGNSSAHTVGARAVTLLRLGRSTEALASMNEIIERQPMVRINYSRRGVLLLRLGRVVNYDSKDPDAQLALGLALHRSGHDEQARDALQKAIELRAAGSYGADRGAWDQRATSFPPDHFALAMVFEKLGRKQAALAEFQHAVARMNATYPRYPSYVLLEEEASRLLGVR